MIIPANEDIIVNAFEKVAKSVVNIASVRIVHDQVFRVFPIEGVGSGIVVDNKGYILTNNHVVDKAHKLTVTCTDRNVFSGQVVGTDKVTDLAVVRVDSKEALSTSHLGNSDMLKIGQTVIAIGNPFGLTGGPTVTAGIVSALNRNLQFENDVVGLIQTDAAINPGNSGGPLINTKGEVIGINTAKMSYAQGIGFAIPINTANAIMKDLIENGRVTNRPWVGIATIKITAQLARYYRLPTNEGTLVAEVQAHSPADNAGLRKGDIIEEIDGRRIGDPSQISSDIRRKAVSDSISITVNRYGRRIEVKLKLEAHP